MPDDDIALLNQLRRDGEISQEQYETLRRHVLWGTPLPELLEETLGGDLAEADSASEAPAEEATVEMPDPGRTVVPPDDGRTVILSKPPSNVPRQRPTDPQRPRRFTPTLPGAPAPPPRTPPTVGNQPRVNPPPAAFRPRTGPAGAPNVPPQRPARPPYSGPPRPPAHRPAPPPAQRPAPSPPPAGPPAQRPPQSKPSIQGGRSSRLPLIAGGAVLVVALAAAGTWWFALRGGDDLSPTKYAGTVCPDLTSWQSDIAKSASSMTSTVNAANDPAAKQKAAESFFTNAGTRTDQLVTALQSDGTPSSAKSQATRLVEAAKSASASFKSSAQQTGELETSASSFSSGLQVIVRDPQQPVDAVRQVLAKAPGDLGRAYRSESSCSGLRLPSP